MVKGEGTTPVRRLFFALGGVQADCGGGIHVGHVRVRLFSSMDVGYDGGVVGVTIDISIRISQFKGVGTRGARS